ncbi:hypothetical protein [Caproiciproducens sp. CPB-2]|uniref:hypothetical protein n=1 Tax=Caproiciproducens sp. CPB-2 TaxID=3030017 RepID=UPI0023D9D7E3|nr:hypothetical protein [Caproiciproducens sp. CPB-2]
MKNHIEASSAAQKRAWIYIRKTHTPDSYYNSLEETLRSFAATQNLAVAGVSIDFNRRRGGYGVSQMLQAANEGAFDILWSIALASSATAFSLPLTSWPAWTRKASGSALPVVAFSISRR